MAAERILTIPGNLAVPNGSGVDFTAASGGLLAFYKTGTFVPTVTFATPGTLAVTYSVQVGEYTAIGNLVFATIHIVTTVFTLGTAAGNFLIGTLPYAANSATNYAAVGACSMQGWTKANYTNTVLNLAAGGSNMTVLATGSAQNDVALAVGDIAPPAGVMHLSCSILYQIS